MPSFSCLSHTANSSHSPPCLSGLLNVCGFGDGIACNIALLACAGHASGALVYSHRPVGRTEQLGAMDMATSAEHTPSGKHEQGGAHWQNFPAGLRVLAVDDDPLCLKVIEQMLKRCSYEGVGGASCTHSLNAAVLCMQLTKCCVCSDDMHHCLLSFGLAQRQRPRVRPGAFRRLYAR